MVSGPPDEWLFNWEWCDIMASTMDVEGVIRTILPVTSGESNGRAWQRGGFVLEVQNGSYVDSVCFEQWTNNLSVLDGFNVGDHVVVSFNVRSREYQGRWFTSVSAWRMQRAGQSSEPRAAEAMPPTGQPLPSSNAGGANSGTSQSIDEQLDNLPF